MRSALNFDLPFDKIFSLSLFKSTMLDNVTKLFAIISAANFFTAIIKGIV